ncbi:MAG: LuxR C-terminal-related transcriptional regulator [Oscillospiraceae bacterium]|nr:LuxR C-terminal-related transcriptional regulator [Oscillospiraceae bacterium]
MEQTALKAQAPRTTLMKLLDDLVERQIIYMHAPAGFGKTVSSSLWLEHRERLAGIKRSWISLDEHDNKTAEFCKRFVSALSGLQPENTELSELAAHPVFNTAPVEFTLHALSAFSDLQDSCIFVLDDLHIIKNEEILNLLPVLFKRLPDACRILLLSRAAPPDSFSEMMMKDGITVVDAEYLQFTSGEIKIFFSKNGRFITSKQADEIFASTGGWAIGIRALLLAEEKSYNINLTGQYLENFIKTHVWERWDVLIKSFMTLVSVVKELTPELCEWLVADEKTLQKASGAEILSGLARENAFLRETGRNTYQFHDLFRDFLINMLEQEGGEQAAAAQWNRAGDYYFGKNDCYRAVKCYLKGKNDNGVAKSLYSMYDYNSHYASIEDTLYTVRLSVSDSLVEKHPFLLEVQAWAAFVEGRADDLEGFLDRYYKMFSKIVLQNPRSAIIVMLLRCMDYRNSFVHLLKTIRMVPFKGSVKAYTPSITHSMPFFHRSSRDFSDLALDTDKNILLAEKSFGVIIGTEFAVIKECLHAGFHYERGNLDEACAHALSACANIPENCSAEIWFCAMMILASALFAGGQNAEVEKVLDNVEEMIDRDKAFYLKPNLRAYLFRLKLTGGDKEAAKEWLKDNSGDICEHLTFFKSYQQFTTARAHIVTGNYNHAVLSLQKLLQLNERYRRTLDIIEARILLAIVYWKKGRGGQPVAIDFLERAAAMAFEYGYTQVFANEGAELSSMLHRLQKRAVQADYQGGVPSAFLKTLYVAAVSGSKRSKGLTGGRAPENLSFTEKQKTVMRLMCEGCSRNEIAERTGLKPSGVKSHAELIYRKLDVVNSIEAALKIKELGLLSEKQEQ